MTKSNAILVKISPPENNQRQTGRQTDEQRQETGIDPKPIIIPIIDGCNNREPLNLQGLQILNIREQKYFMPNHRNKCDA